MLVQMAKTEQPSFKGYDGTFTKFGSDMPTNFGANNNVRRAYDFLTGDGIVDRSGGALQPMTPEAASGLIGGWIVETGSD